MTSFVTRNVSSCRYLFNHFLSRKNRNVAEQFRRLTNGGSSESAHSFWDAEGSVAVEPASSHGEAAETEPVQPKEVTDQLLIRGPVDFLRLTKFGHIRLDSDNPARWETEEVPESQDQYGFIDQSFFGTTVDHTEVVQEVPAVSAAAWRQSAAANEVDRQYFHSTDEAVEAIKPGQQQASRPSTPEDLDDCNEVDIQYMAAGQAKDQVSALDFLRRRQSETAAVASYAELVPKLSQLPDEMIVSMLAKRLVHRGDGLVALNKPYGLVTTDVDRSPSRNVSLTDLLPRLAQKLGVDKLYTVHRLDRDTTGVLLLATDQAAAKRLNDLFHKRLVKKTYLALTKNVPEPHEGTIDIPIGLSTLLDRQRMKLRPVDSAAPSGSGRSLRAVTHFQVKRWARGLALVELQPETGARHQLRVHLAQALHCPVLGDHKYSHSDRYAPQKLPADLVAKLGLQPTKVRQLPMHLHASQVILPADWNANDRELVIRAPLPSFFRHTMSKLKLKNDGSKKT